MLGHIMHLLVLGGLCTHVCKCPLQFRHTVIAASLHRIKVHITCIWTSGVNIQNIHLNHLILVCASMQLKPDMAD